MRLPPFKRAACLLLLLLLAAKPMSDISLLQVADCYPSQHWGRPFPPELLGFSPERLKEAEAYWKSLKSSALMVLAGGVLLVNWGRTARVMFVASVRKSLLSALYGIHVHEGRVGLNKTMADLGIDDSEPSLTAAEKRATVADLLSGRSGVYHPALAETLEMQALRPPRGSHEPGTFWYYNNWDFNVLGTIFMRETGKDIYQEFKDRIADPLQMGDYSRELNRYHDSTSLQSRHAPYPFHMSARDLARFGLLYLRKGQWKGRQRLPRAWVEESTKARSRAVTIDGTDAGGYGYLWWVADHGRHFPNVSLPDGSYSARGDKGHYIIVIPEYDVVIVHRPAWGGAVTEAEFGALVNLVLYARFPDRIRGGAPPWPCATAPE